MRYLITGATGAIGSAVVRRLAGEGKEVRAFARDAKKLHRLLPDVPAEMVTGDAQAAAGMMHTFAWDVTMDGAALRRDTGFTPQVGYVEGIARTVEWFPTLWET